MSKTNKKSTTPHKGKKTSGQETTRGTGSAQNKTEGFKAFNDLTVKITDTIPPPPVKSVKKDRIKGDKKDRS